MFGLFRRTRESFVSFCDDGSGFVNDARARREAVLERARSRSLVYRGGLL